MAKAVVIFIVAAVFTVVPNFALSNEGERLWVPQFRLAISPVTVGAFLGSISGQHHEESIMELFTSADIGLYGGAVVAEHFRIQLGIETQIAYNPPVSGTLTVGRLIGCLDGIITPRTSLWEFNLGIRAGATLISVGDSYLGLGFVIGGQAGVVRWVHDDLGFGLEASGSFEGSRAGFSDVVALTNFAARFVVATSF